ncbi:MAG: glycine cleavage system aminomethyltransferase GcvT [Fimbriimonadaceae bacterium]
MTTALQTPLHADHVALGGRMVEFAGYDLPVQYQGVIAESNAVRQGAGMFDVSHMARIKVTGGGAFDFLQWVTTNELNKLSDGHGQYSILPNAHGGAVDDIILYRLGGEEFKVVLNAANHAKDVAHLRAEDKWGVTIEDYTESTAMIAVQGPDAVNALAGLCPDPGLVRDTPFFGTFDADFAGVPCFAARSGYTGEDGYELQCQAGDASRLWRALLGAGVAACGLGSRDTLRVEAGLPLYGHELTDEMSPLCAGLGWVVSKDKEFLGSSEFARVREEGVPQKLQGIRLEGKRLPMPGMTVLVGGSQAGTVSSGVFSPLLDCGIAFAFLGPSVAHETPCEVEFRGSMVPGTVVNKRFYKR